METFLKQTGITYLVPGVHTEFDSVQSSHTGLHRAAQPTIITLPESAAHVAAIVKHCIAVDQDFIVRGGGHDCHGRYTAKGAVSIDLRRLKSVTVAPDRKTASVGGGTTLFKFLETLEKQQLHGPSGICGDVGYVGWCLIGGVGPWSTCYGIGSDQIVGAQVVNACGELVRADEKLLKGLRGGGGCLAIVVELVVKVYPIKEVRATTVKYRDVDTHATVSTFYSNLQKLLNDGPSMPPELCLMPFYLIDPRFGPTMAADFIWTGPVTDEYHLWLKLIASLAPLMRGELQPWECIQKTSSKEFVDLYTKGLPRTVHGNTQAVSITHYSPQAVSVLADMAATLPESSAGGFNTHTIRRESPACSPARSEHSIAPYRTPQVVFEILGFAAEEESAAECMAWAREFRNRLAKTDVALPASYLALTAPEFVELEKTYHGGRLAELKRLKQEYDPKGIFKHTLPHLG